MPAPTDLPLSVLVREAAPLAARLVDASGADLDGDDVVVRDISFDSRAVEAGTIFCCVRGEHADGHDFAPAAVAAGAVAVVADHPLPALDARVAQVLVDDTRPAMGHLAAALYGHPSSRLQVVGVTGTNGKTTTAHILAHAMDALGRPAGVIGTLSGAHTTPESPELQRRLAAFVDDGKTSVAMEVSSHALALDRVIGVRFAMAVFTNLGRDHLDLHETQERYFAAKARLFEDDLSDQGVVNLDDVHGRLLADVATIPLTGFSMNDVDDVVIGAFEHRYRWRGEQIRVGLGGRFNVLNSLAAATALAQLGDSPADIAAAIATTPPVRGRFEPVEAGQAFAVIVDYAHTPDALIEVLAAARQVSGDRRVIVVFGCGGDRDHDKRPQMGQAAAEGADLVVVTSDNPRSEDPEAIINDVIAGAPPHYRDRIVVEPDRHDAIALALDSARSGDVVVIAGKGHETTQTFRETVAPFDDRAVARTLLEARS